LQATGVFELHIPLSNLSLRSRLALSIGALLAVAFLSVYLGLILFLVDNPSLDFRTGLPSLDFFEFPVAYVVYRVLGSLAVRMPADLLFAKTFGSSVGALRGRMGNSSRHGSVPEVKLQSELTATLCTLDCTLPGRRFVLFGGFQNFVVLVAQLNTN